MLNKVLLAALIAVGAIFALYFALPAEDEPLKMVPKKEEKRVHSFDYEVIGKGPLALRNEIQSFPFPDLSGEIAIVAQTSRPDIPSSETRFLLGLQGEEVEVASGQNLYLSYSGKELGFSKEVTPLWVQPKVDEEGETWLEMGVELVSKEGEKLLDETRSFKVDVQETFKEVGTEEIIEAVEQLKEAKWWGPDRLYSQYGGEDYEPYKECERLEVEGKKILFASEGKTFVWRSGMWEESEETRGFVMARVEEISPYKMEVALWDKSGLESVLLTFKRERPSRMSLRVEELFTRIRQRTTSRISCRIDNRAVILKTGDWVIHKPNGWHIVKTASEVEAILNFEMEGELFVFDGLEKVDDKQIFCGALFNPMRTTSQSIKLPMTQKNKKLRTANRKRELIDED
ncbi:hypothetical protein [Candidatus Neptunochlamydia vexilliferae]|uniref:DUF4340 domain-containing protein n=1 Tax=Candidatus Neptunichlamydia vexilliferae TaxID=1651774 RepID=A0ABS0AZ99_9BACT|nr:hypothetical protein [Candidatus Neptunochlamydia vexilliferae]MBF5059274.1 hypothetical protein [Candidatus Neptunochlamydia vexilliferae]